MEKKYRIQIFPNHEVIVVLFKGTVQLKDMIDYLDELYAHRDFDQGFSILYDFRGSFALGYRMEVFTFMDKLKKLRSESSKHKKIAALIDGLNQRFLGKIFLKLAKSINMDFEMFDYPEPCVQWITENQEKQKVLLGLIADARKELV